MLNYRNFVWIASLCLALSLMAFLFLNASVWIIISVVFAGIFVLFLGVVRIQMRFFIPSIVSGDKSLKKVALTFDDGPDENTLKVASCLEKHGIVGTFFFIGHKIKANSNIVRRIDESGHLIGNHGYYHQWFFPLKFPSKIKAEIDETNYLLEQATGKKVQWFRAPFGLTNPWVAKAVKQTGMSSVAWSVRSYDTVIGAGNLLSLTLKRKVHNGAIILLHDSGDEMVGFLDAFIPWLKKSGFQVVSLQDLIHEKAYN